MTQPNFVTAIIRNQDKLLMIYVQGDTDPEPYWSLPGGRVEKGETVEDALIREVQEETGLTVLKIGNIAYQTQMQFDDIPTLALVYEVSEWQGTANPNDPEGEILSAEWVPLEQAMQYLSKIDFPPMSEPPIAYLSKTVIAGKIWHYSVAGNGKKWISNME